MSGSTFAADNLSGNGHFIHIKCNCLCRGNFLLVWSFLYFMRYICSFQLSFMWYPQCLIQPIIESLIWGSRRHPKQGVPDKHPYLIMEGYTLFILCSCTQMLVSSSFDQNALGCCTNISKCHLDPLFILQKKILRKLTFSWYDISSQILFTDLNILPIYNLIQNRIRFIMFKLVNGLLPEGMN